MLGYGLPGYMLGYGLPGYPAGYAPPGYPAGYAPPGYMLGVPPWYMLGVPPWYIPGYSLLVYTVLPGTSRTYIRLRLVMPRRAAVRSGGEKRPWAQRRRDSLGESLS